jgi:GDSL-like Lipase/Acylhydrolase family
MPDAQADLFNFRYSLPNLTESLKKQRNIKIVAIGSSSTAGEADVLPYPSRLEMLLRDRFRDRMIDVLNRGIGGQEAPSELLRFETDVVAEAPALVIWQVGTNAVFRKDEFRFDDVVAAIVGGLRRMAALPVDVLIMDSQYTPAVVDGEKLKLSEELVTRIANAADDAGVNVFRRFALMREWADHRVPMEELVRDGDQLKLHMSDWATHCVTAALFRSIRRAVEAAGAT